MKKVPSTFLFCAVFLMSAAASLYAQDFHGADWGMKMEQVEITINGELTFYAGESFSVLGTDEILLYDRKCIAVYFFSHMGNLVKGGYYFRPGYPDGIMYQSDYKRLSDIMTGSYGESRERLVWHTDWHYEPRDYMKAVKNGDLSMMKFWESDASFIELSLEGNSKEYSLSLQYYSKDRYEEYVDMLLERAIAEGDSVDSDGLGAGE